MEKIKQKKCENCGEMTELRVLGKIVDIPKKFFDDKGNIRDLTQEEIETTIRLEHQESASSSRNNPNIYRTCINCGIATLYSREN